MDHEFAGFWIAGLILIAIGILVLVLWAEDYGEMVIKKEAKELGYMEFKFEQKTGRTKLDWK